MGIFIKKVHLSNWAKFIPRVFDFPLFVNNINRSWNKLCPIRQMNFFYENDSPNHLFELQKKKCKRSHNNNLTVLMDLSATVTFLPVVGHTLTASRSSTSRELIFFSEKAASPSIIILKQFS